MSDPARAHLLETWQTCQQAAAWLRRSFDKSPLPPYVEVNENDWDQLEALSGRFARLTDLIVHKLLRALNQATLDRPICSIQQCACFLKFIAIQGT